MSTDTSVKKWPNYIKSKRKAMNATLSNTKSSSSEDNSDREGNFIASTAIAEVVGGNYGEPSDLDDKEDI